MSKKYHPGISINVEPWHVRVPYTMMGIELGIGFLKVMENLLEEPLSEDPIYALQPLMDFNFTLEVPTPPRIATYAVGTLVPFTFQNQFGTYNAWLYYDPDKPLPAGCIIFAHGFAARTKYYLWIAEYLITLGYVCVFFDTPRRIGLNSEMWSVGFSSCIDALTVDYQGYVKSDAIAIAGHSMGGLGTLKALADDQRIKCGVPLSPAIFSGFIGNLLKTPEPDTIKIPTMIIHGSLDKIVSARNVENYYKEMDQNKHRLWMIEGANHLQFMNSEFADAIMDSPIGGIIDNKPTIETEKVHDIVKENLKEWCKLHLTVN